MLVPAPPPASWGFNPASSTSQLYQWRAKAQQQQSASAREQALAEENARLKRQLAEKSEEIEIAKKAALRSTGQCNGGG